jgi:hypothetical protein
MPVTRHAVMFSAYDQVPEQHDLTVQALESVLAQDIGPMDVLVIDNGSTLKDTWEHFKMVAQLYLDRDDPVHLHTIRNPVNISPLQVANRALRYFFKGGHDKVLGVPSDVYLPPNFYRLLNEWPRGLVTASEHRDRNHISLTGAFCEWEVCAVAENTPMATGIIRKWFHDALVAQEGHFLDEGFWMYASDCDLAKRMAACGIRGVQLSVPYYHYGSGHWKLLPPEKGKIETDKADADRAYFEKKWGHKVDDLEYGRSCGDINFKGKALEIGKGAASV